MRPMRTVPQADLDQQLGEGTVWFPKQLPGRLVYRHGVDTFDALQTELPADLPSRLYLRLRPRGLELWLVNPLRVRLAGLPFRSLRAIALQELKGTATEVPELVPSAGILVLEAAQDDGVARCVASVPQARDLGRMHVFLKKHLRSFYYP